MLKYLLLISALFFNVECYVRPRDEYTELLDTVIERLKLFRRNEISRENRYNTYERMPANRYDQNDLLDLFKRTRSHYRQKTYDKHDSNHYHDILRTNGKVPDKIVDKKIFDFEKTDENQDEHLIQKNGELKKHTIKMPNVKPKEADTYFCYGYELPSKENYIVEFEPLAKQQVAHHMLLFGCNAPFKKSEAWNCREMQPVCGGGGIQKIMYAWAKNAPSLRMPKDVGFRVGEKSGINYLVLQVHYLHKFKHGHKDASGLTVTTTSHKPSYFAGIYLLADGYHSIPPHQRKVHIDVGCEYTDEFRLTKPPKIYPFRFRTHAHSLGLVITGYRVRDGKWTLIGRGDPQRPQAFYKVFNDIEVKEGDKLFARCTYNSTSRSKITHIGATHTDEMCNFYIMYFHDASKFHPAMPPCKSLYADGVKYPSDSDIPLAEAEEKNKESAASATSSLPELYRLVDHWPAGGNETGTLRGPIGQISGVAFNEHSDQVLVFHRGDREWDYSTFDSNDTVKNRTLIQNNTILWLNKLTGKLVKAKGARMFSLPHGITVDYGGNIWVTDVGAHQVFKLSPDMKVLMSLGKRFVKGNDSQHFCKPADVAVMTDGSFFVADGYCNQRILKFDHSGKVMLTIDASSFSNTYNFPKPYHMSIVHSIALDERNDRLFVADRENERILIFGASTGEFKSHIPKGTFGGPVYGVAYNDNNGGLLHVINGPGLGRKVEGSGFTYSLTLKRVIAKWAPKGGFHRPHDIAVSESNQYVFVAEIGPNKIWNFKNTHMPQVSDTRP